MIDTTILLGKQLLFNVGVEYPNKKKNYCKQVEYYNSIQLKILYNKSRYGPNLQISLP